MLEQLQKRFGLTYLFIAHDLSVMEHISTRIAVMYLGSADPDPTVTCKRIMPGAAVPNPIRPPSGCRFHTHGPITRPDCSHCAPVLKEKRPSHWAACHYHEQVPEA
ncbi:hypothetical protein [Reyranella sp.]|uniref:hypothetical protein n=1 Tax=Reyranella sp. TaxID=1929291 RepID=UPI003D0A89A5